MSHPSKIGGFLQRYVRKGIGYDRAKDHCQGKTLLANRAEQKRKEARRARNSS
jgi:hypothetical protein